jgi:carbon storage regulator
MLVLTRKVDQSIMIGDHVRTVVVDVRGDQVKLGIDAPRHIMVHRHEVYEVIQEENKRAALQREIDVGTLEKALREVRPDAQSDL